MKTLDIVALIVLVIGGLNWLLVGAFNFDLVAALFGGQAALISRIVYILVGISAVYCLRFFWADYPPENGLVDRLLPRYLTDEREISDPCFSVLDGT